MCSYSDYQGSKTLTNLTLNQLYCQLHFNVDPEKKYYIIGIIVNKQKVLNFGLRIFCWFKSINVSFLSGLTLEITRGHICFHSAIHAGATINNLAAEPPAHLNLKRGISEVPGQWGGDLNEGSGWTAKDHSYRHPPPPLPLPLTT